MNFPLGNGLRCVLVLSGCCLSLTSMADMSDDKRKLWAHEKTLHVNEFLKKYDDEIKRVFPSYVSGDPNAGVAALNATVAKMKAEEPFERVMKSDVTQFLRSTNAEAMENFKDNPLCVRAVTVYQTIVDDVASGKTSPFSAIWNYPQSVLVSCMMSPKAGQFLEKNRTNH